MRTRRSRFPGQRIGLMGGTFNPPHEGHVVCAETALKRLKLDQLWWIVTPGNPLKIAVGAAEPREPHGREPGARSPIPPSR